MSFVSAIAMFTLSLCVLLLARHWAVNAAGGILRRLKFSQAVVSFICAMVGFIAIETALVICGQACNEKTLTLGMIVGSVIAGVGLVGGLSALIKPYSIEDNIFRREVPLFFIALALLYLLGKDFELSRIDGLIMIASFGLFAWAAFSDDKFTGIDAESLSLSAVITKSKDSCFFILPAAVGGLVAGGIMLVRYAPYLAGFTGLRKWGSAIVFLGAAIALAKVVPFWAFSKKTHVSLAALLTAGIANILLVLGVMALIKPLYLKPLFIGFELPAMALFSAAILAVARSGRTINRVQGLLMVVGYFIFSFILYSHFR